MAPVIRLLTGAFAYMDGLIDPPSSLTRMTPESFAAEARDKELWVIPGPDGPVACIVLSPAADHLYLGKLAVAAEYRGRSLARQMIALAERRARALGLPRLRLQSRVELSGNHATFAHMGFRETARTAHPGHDRPTSITFEKPVLP